jgi:hypothetical protein
MIVPLLGEALILSFIICCLLSAVLQGLAWARHARSDQRVTLRALWRADEYFDEIGERQIRLARKLLLTGGVAYLGYGALLLGSSIMAAAG